MIGDTLYLADKAIKEPVSTVSQGLLKLSNIDVDGEIHRRDIGLKKDIKKEHRHHGSRGKKFGLCMEEMNKKLTASYLSNVQILGWNF